VDRPPRIWLQSSTATIYRHTFDRPNDEFTGVLGGDEPDAPDTWRFSIGVATRWEQAATQVNLPNTRLVLLRSAMIMTPDRGGVFDTLQWLTHLGLSGPVAGGVQYMSWVHGTDFCRALAWIIEHPDLSGPVNIASPNPLPHKEFMAELRRAAGVPFGLPATAWMVEIASFFLRTESELILKSRWVVPGKLLKSGFEFKFPEWESAAAELVQK
jgi:hypothetical protein